ncbi:MAG TPA: peptidoglycan-binding protein [Oscillospiraceae bacterium]|nr:peptidoglycan-binding protein [Oscillospiraceae bacterium]HXK77355.1 peptidoglycan-binding protein [Oscillospiraceae bacterium]
MNGNNTSTVENTSGGYGMLEVHVFTDRMGSPAAEALVRVIDPDTGAVLEEARTNMTGRIPPVTLATPPLSNSLQPGQPRPFNQYNLTITLEGFEEASVENVQLYPTCTALQNVVLKPLYGNILIPYPVLWGDFPPKIPESEVKKLPFPKDLVVLPRPVVPGLIIVHTGKPDDTTAPNYTVTFKEYIKNVASSEIYATWPRETLKANILAILSFTMSRVYTEWYRSKGYDFTITSSTAYDQAFTFGRNIYQEISEVVDEVFTTYISRQDIVQPLFTQYNDGIQVDREGWLSQWGSKNLGEKGYTAVQILKNYYGYDIVLKEAEKVEGIPISFPGTVLKIGSTGEYVKVIQQQLNAISENYPLIPKLVVDGIYGEDTAASVKIFQEVFGLPTTGEVNYPTWYRISEIFLAVTMPT